MTYRLRDYQEDIDQAIRFGHQEYDSIAIEEATGLGKTVSFVMYAVEFNKHATQNHRVMVIVPQITLLSQAAKKIERVTGIMPAIEQADQWSDETDWGRSDFVVASKQSLCSQERYKRFKDVGLVIVDECHYCATESYKTLLDYFLGLGAKILGVSATLKRNDKLALEQCFEACVFQYGIQEAISEGWLVTLNVTCKQLKSLNLKGVTTTNTQFGKDFNARELNEKLENPEVIYEIAAAVAEETRDSKTAIFCSSVEEANAVSDLLEDLYGIRSSWICADTKRCSKADREERLKSFTEPGGITHLANVGILTTGWDYPALECVVMARPTKSLPLYTQIIGRVTRPIEGTNGFPVVDFDGSTAMTRQEAIRTSNKPYGRVIDLVDNSLEHKLITCADVLGGRWELAQRDDSTHVCRFCLNEFSNRMMLSMHVTEEHAEQAEKVQQRAEEILKAEEEILLNELRAQRAKLKAEAEFHNQKVNPFGSQQGSSRGKSQVTMASTKQRKYLWVLGFKDVDKFQVSKGQASRMIGQFRQGKTASEVRRTNRLAGR